MLVPTMQEEELVIALRRDLPEVLNFSDKKDTKFRRLVIKSNRFPVYASCEYTSKSKNKWILFLEARNKKEYGDNSRLAWVCLAQTAIGYYVYMPHFVNKQILVNIYPPHFFSRFKLRMDLEETGVELVKRFFTYNYSYVYEDIQGRVAGSTKDGVVLGQRTVNNNFLFKTFITYDMLKGEQLEKYLENEKCRQEIHEQESK